MGKMGRPRTRTGRDSFKVTVRLEPNQARILQLLARSLGTTYTGLAEVVVTRYLRQVSDAPRPGDQTALENEVAHVRVLRAQAKSRQPSPS